MIHITSASSALVRSLTSDATAILKHAFITAWLDYCSSLSTGLPVRRLRCLDRILGSAASLSGCIPKFDHIFSYMLDVLHWLPLQQRNSYHIISLVWRSLLGSLRRIFETSAALPWVFRVVALCSTERSFQQLSRITPFQWLALQWAILGTFVIIPYDCLSFYAHLKTFLFSHTGIGSAPE